MKQVYFITGYPGFLASGLMRQLLSDYKEDIDHIYCLVLPYLKEKAMEEIAQSRIKPHLVTIIPGDITKQDLGMTYPIHQQLKQSVTHVFHLAAIDNLAVPKDIACQINVKGTENVHHWILTLDKLQRYIYFSTAYVSGNREGKIYEHELNEGQGFRNYYEQTKYLAEMAVQKLKETIPTTIIRPGIVTGHSKTGFTIKFDGIYFFLNVYDKLRFLPFLPYFGNGKPEGNFVPSDYVLQATSYLAFQPNSVGKTYHLTNPRPYTIRETQEMIASYYLDKKPRGKIPVAIPKLLLHLKSIRTWLQAEVEAMDYLTIHSTYDCSQTLTDLADTGITCPDFKETLLPLIHFYRKYKDDYTKHIYIP